jgi:glutaredoxin
MRCPKCGYVRKSEEIAPEWQCPSCQVVYAKASVCNGYEDSMTFPKNTASSNQSGSSFSGIFKAVVVLALATCVVYFGYTLFSGITITRETSGNVAEASPIIAPDKTVLLYSRAGCGYCDKAKLFLQKHNVAFEEIDVNTSERGKEDFQKLGAIGTPILIVADTKVVGFDESGLKDVLKSKGLWK